MASNGDATVDGPIDQAFAEGFAQRHLDAWNSHDSDKVLALMTEDIVYEDSGWPTTMRGHAEVREFLEATWRAFPDYHAEIVAGPYLDPHAPRAARHWRCVATHTGPLEPAGLDPTGKRIEFEGAEFDEYRDGKLVRLRGMFDMAEAMRQAGVLPATGSRAERLTIRLANLRTRLRRRH